VARKFLKTGGILFFSLCCLVCGERLHAQEPAAGVPPSRWSGAVELGYRYTDIEGENRYREVVNLMEGLRLFNFNLRFRDPEGNGLADNVRIQANGIGDPYPSGQLDIKRHKAYHIAANYRESKFFFNREDADDLLTDNHDLNQTRKKGAVTLSVFPTDEFRLNLGHSFSRREGEAGVPRIFTFVPNLTQDLDESLDEFFVSASFPVGAWDIFVRQSYSIFSNNDRIDQPPTLTEERDEEVSTRVSKVTAHSQVNDRLDFDAGYVFAHSDGDARLNIRPALQVGSGASDFVYDTHVLESGTSLLLREDLIAHMDYRFHTFDQEGRADTDFFFLPQTVVRTDYHLDAHTGSFKLEHLTAENLTLTAGYRLQYSKIEAENFNPNEFDGGPSSENSNVFSHGWIGAVDWKPSKELSLYGEYEGAVFDNPYTRISAEEEHVGKFRAAYQAPIPDLTLKGTVLWKKKTNPDQQYRLDIQDYIAAAVYQPAAVSWLTLDASFTFEKIRDKKEITTLGGVPPSPFATFVFDSDALIYSGEVRCEEIFRGLSLRLGGSLARTRQENDQEYARGILSLWYKTKWITPILSFERSYLTDNENSADNFSANWITLVLRKEF
jgi:hypothetical protein